MRLVVRRGDGATPAPDELTAELACGEAPATQAGRNYLDEVGRDALEVSLTCLPPVTGGPLPGELVAVRDTLAGESWRGRVTAFTLSMTVDERGAGMFSDELAVTRPLP